MKMSRLLESEYLEVVEPKKLRKLVRGGRKSLATSAAFGKKIKTVKKIAPVKSAWPNKTKYSKYLNSSIWKEKREKHFIKNGRACVVCGDVNETHVHHLVHRGLGAEIPGDLVSVCARHHELFHKRYGTGKRDYRESFNRFLLEES